MTSQEPTEDEVKAATTRPDLATQAGRLAFIKVLNARLPKKRLIAQALLRDEDGAGGGEVGVGAGADDEGHGPILRHAGPMAFDGPWIQLFLDVPRDGCERSVDFWAA